MSTRNEKKYIYCTPRWRRLREVILDETGGLCAVCKRKGYVEEAKIIHHIKPWKEGKTRAERHHLIWDKSNLEPVCEPCHTYLHSNIERDKKAGNEIERMALKMLGLDNESDT